MKVLLVADQESKSLWDYYTPDKLEGIDMIIACGDLKASYIEFLVTMSNVPVFYVAGNHDKTFVEKPPEGCICLDDRVVEYKGIRMLGLGGSMRYKPGPFMYTEKQMRRRIRRVRTEILSHKGFDILVTHAPAKGYGDMSDIAHQGFDCFNELMQRCKPKYMFHGHVHASYSAHNFKRETKHSSGATIVNAYEKYIIEIDENDRNNLPMKVLVRNLMKMFKKETAGGQKDESVND